MKIPTVNKFLFCFDLKYGCLVLGYFAAFVTGVGAVELLIDLIFDTEKLKGELFSKAKQIEELSPAAEMIGDAVQPSESEQKHLPTFGKLI